MLLLLSALFFQSFYKQEARSAVPAIAPHGSDQPPAVRSIPYRMVAASIECGPRRVFPSAAVKVRAPTRIYVAPQNKI